MERHGGSRLCHSADDKLAFTHSWNRDGVCVYILKAPVKGCETVPRQFYPYFSILCWPVGTADHAAGV